MALEDKLLCKPKPLDKNDPLNYRLPPPNYNPPKDEKQPQIELPLENEPNPRSNYKERENKEKEYEILILDIEGEEIYKDLYSTFRM